MLRACALAGVPAVEMRAVSNELSEGDRSRWRIGRALEALADVAPERARGGSGVASCAHGERAKRGGERPLPPPLPPASARWGSSSGKRSAPTARASGGRSRSASSSRRRTRSSGRRTSRGDLASRACSPLTALLLSVSYVYAASLVVGRRARSLRAEGRRVRRRGALVFLPVPLLVALFVLPGLVWLALVRSRGACRARRGARRARARSRRGSRARRGSTARPRRPRDARALVVLISPFSLYFVLREYADNTRMLAAALASLVVSPVVFLGSAILYVDQDARLRSRRRPTRGVRCRPT